MAASSDIPDYDDLPRFGGDGPRCSWGVWGADDRFGCLNLLPTGEDLVRARDLVRRGEIFPLDWNLALPDPPLFERTSYRHTVSWIVEGLYHDDMLDNWNTQSSSQWDGFRHIGFSDGTRTYFYGDVADERHGVDVWAERGIVARAVLADVERFRQREGRPIDYAVTEPIPVSDVAGALAAQGTEVRPGDILLVRTGWLAWYLGLHEAARRHEAVDLHAPGLEPGEDTLRYLWNLHVAAVASDTPSFETWPPKQFDKPEADQLVHTGSADFMHPYLLALLGLPIGEMFFLEDLARAAADDGRYDGLLTSAPMHLRSGVASPPNALVLR